MLLSASGTISSTYGFSRVRSGQRSHSHFLQVRHIRRLGPVSFANQGQRFPSSVQYWKGCFSTMACCYFLLALSINTRRGLKAGFLTNYVLDILGISIVITLHDDDFPLFRLFPSFCCWKNKMLEEVLTYYSLFFFCLVTLWHARRLLDKNIRIWIIERGSYSTLCA